MSSPTTSPAVGISAREAEVLVALGEHLTNAEIGTRLFISIRTVESHVSSLLRKLQADDRRALAAIAGSLPAGRPDGSAAHIAVQATLPSPLTPFIGRVAERTELAAALIEHRLVTAVGPGGVGKTRLALSVAADMKDETADGVWYVDLVPVTDPLMIASTVAAALGLGERPGSDAADTVMSWLAGRQTLLVLDNCEHLLDGLVVWLERLLAACPRLVVLATSRARLLVPFERVFPVPGLAVQGPQGQPGDAVRLFLSRAAAGGTPVRADDTERVAALCRALDGMALAIELAAARYASLGIDGLESGLDDRLRLLTGGQRIDDRHRSLRSALDWSYELLDPTEQAVLRRITVFAEAFTSASATQVLADWPPVHSAEIVSILADLADKSLLTAIPGRARTRYLALETIRQYGAERLTETGEAVDIRSRHLAWCLVSCAHLELESGERTADWRAAFDEVADELRGALAWVTDADGFRDQLYQLAIGVGNLAFLRGLPAEAQRRYEQAALFTEDDRAAADAWRHAAGAAESRNFGDHAWRLRQLAVEAALRAGDTAGAAADLGRNAERVSRGPGLMAHPPPPDQARVLIERGRALVDGDPQAEVRLLIAEAFAGSDSDPETARLTDRALALARELDDPLAESAALDQLTAVQLVSGDVRAASASARRRTELLAPLPINAITGFEMFDAFVMAAECAIAVGDLDVAQRSAEGLRDLPFYREEGHLATSRLLVVTALSGDWPQTVVLAERFREGWERAGRPRAGNLATGAYAAATVHGLRGDDDGRAAWLHLVDTLITSGRSISKVHFARFFDALLALHRGSPSRALGLATIETAEFTDWQARLWRPWHAALWAEAAVLADPGAAGQQLSRARNAARGIRSPPPSWTARKPWRARTAAGTG